MTYTKLKAGDIRKFGDEMDHCLGPYGGYWTPTEYNKTKEERWTGWKKVQSLIGYPILQSDLVVAEFRREVAVD